MNRRELAAKLANAGVPAAIYSLNGDWTALAYDGYLLTQGAGGWSVQYFERGVTRDLARFGSESEACDFLYEKLTRPAMLEQLRSRKPSGP